MQTVKRPPVRRDSLFFSVLAVSMSATGFAGFWFTYFGPIFDNTYPQVSATVHLHGGSFFLWYLFFPLQALLVAYRRTRLHMVLGRLSVVLVVLMTLTGLLVLSVRVDEAMEVGGPPIWLMYGPLILSSLVLFVVFYGAAVWAALNRRMQSHKRFMVVSSAAGLGAGLFRLVNVLSGYQPWALPVGAIGCSLFILVGMAYDAATRRSVHPAYGIGLVGMVGLEVALLPQVSEAMVFAVNRVLAALGEQVGFLY